MTNSNEFKSSWTALLAATAGMSSGLGLNAYINNIFGPYLLDAFGWSKADFALNGAISIITVLWIPVIGRMADLFGVRNVRVFGFQNLSLLLGILFCLGSGSVECFFDTSF